MRSNFAFSSQISLEKIEFQIVLLKLQRFNNTVEKIILNKTIIKFNFKQHFKQNFIKNKIEVELKWPKKPQR